MGAIPSNAICDIISPFREGKGGGAGKGIRYCLFKNTLCPRFIKIIKKKYRIRETLTILNSSINTIKIKIIEGTNLLGQFCYFLSFRI